MKKPDRWIIAHSAPVGAEKLHAIGYITYRWNSCELWLRLLLACVSGQKWNDTWAAHHDSRTSDISKKIRDAINKSYNSKEVKDTVLYALQLYDLNRLNRNQFTHFIASATKGGGVEMRNSKNPSWGEIFEVPAIRSELEDVRRVAEEIETMSAYMAGVFNYFSEREYRGILKPEPPLPDKPPLPKRLWIPPPAQGSPPRRNPPRSSPPSP